MTRTLKTLVPACLIIAGLLLVGCQPASENAALSQDAPASGPIKVEVVATDDGGFQLLRGGEPYEIKGAGLEFGDMENLSSHGGNSIRTWRTENGVDSGQEVLDEALRNGLTVAMCIEIERERHGFDYDDPEAVARQFEHAKQEVMKYKDHPALLMWIIGNELNLNATNPKVWDAVNEISEWIHEIDPNHPTTTTLAGINQDLVDDIKERAPDLDMLSIQMYGDLPNLPRYIDETGWTGPYMVTEWGATGHWEVGKTSWGAPIENHSSQKADSYLERYNVAIEAEKAQQVGSYVFLWGQKQERTPTWYGLFLENGEETEAIDVMHYIWNGSWPANRTPRLESMELDGKTAYDNVTLAPNQTYAAEAVIADPEGDTITYRWEIMPESEDLGEGGDYEETPEVLEGLVTGADQAQVTVQAPQEPGAYRLFVYAYDGNGHAAHANIPFLVAE